MAVRESKAELTDRLRREGRFEAFKKRREELKASGVPAPEAWYLAATEFPPPVTQPAAKASAADLRALKGKPAVSVVQAAAWAFEHLDADWVTPADAPSAGAWSMREWAKSNMAARTEFYRTFVARIVQPPQEEARQAEKERLKRRNARTRVEEDIDRLLAHHKQSDDSVKPEQPLVT
jgi:hypothetical protein